MKDPSEEICPAAFYLVHEQCGVIDRELSLALLIEALEGVQNHIKEPLGFLF